MVIIEGLYGVIGVCVRIFDNYIERVDFAFIYVVLELEVGVFGCREAWID